MLHFMFPGNSIKSTSLLDPGWMFVGTTSVTACELTNMSIIIYEVHQASFMLYFQEATSDILSFIRFAFQCRV